MRLRAICVALGESWHGWAFIRKHCRRLETRIHESQNTIDALEVLFGILHLSFPSIV
jgi:hypothetical protein